MDKNKVHGALWGAFCADAYALGPHWEYNTRTIESASLDRESFNDPIAPYHKGKKAGDFTHYGDQMLWLLESVVEKRAFSLPAFGKLWYRNMKAYTGYLDHASADTLKNLNNGADWFTCGSDSTELSAVGRMAPLLLTESGNPAALKHTAEAQASLTHNSKPVREAAALFADLTSPLLEGKALLDSLETAAAGGSTAVQQWVEAGIKSSSKKTSLAIKRFGQACDLPQGFPGVIHLVVKYSSNYRKMAEENAWSGGDSAARGLLAGMVLGIINGEEGIPEAWKKSLASYREISELIRKLEETS